MGIRYRRLLNTDRIWNRIQSRSESKRFLNLTLNVKNKITRVWCRKERQMLFLIILWNMITVFKEPGSGSVPEGHLRNPFESGSETLIGSSNYEYNTYRTVHTVELGSNLGSQDQLLDTGARYEEVTSWRQIILQALEHGSLPTSSAQRLGTDLATYR